MARIKIVKSPKRVKIIGKYQVGGEECPEGQIKDQFGNCVPNPEQQPAQQKMGARNAVSTPPPQTPAINISNQSSSITGNVPTIQMPKSNAFDIWSNPPDINGVEKNAMNMPKQTMVDANDNVTTRGVVDIGNPTLYEKKQIPNDSKKSKKSGNNFFQGLDDFNTKLNLGLNVLGAGINEIDQRKKYKDFQKKQRESLLPDNYYAVNTSQNRGDYDVNDGMFRPNQMGYKSKGTQANAYYAPQNYTKYGGLIRAADGMEVPTAIPLQDSFIQQSSVFVPQLSDLAQPGSVMPATPAPTKKETASESTENIADVIAAKESGGNYKALPKKKDGTLASSAVGKYQFLWNQNKDWIGKVTGITTKEGFMNNPEAQEAAFQYWDETVLTPNAQKIKNELGVNVPLNNIKYTIHFAGPSGAYKYFATGEETRDAFGSTTSKYAGLSRNSVNDLSGFASQHGFDVTSTTGGSHNKGSKHYQGKAIDVRTKNKSPQEIANFIAKAEQQGYKVLDERQRPAGQEVWGGPHLHLEKSELGGQNNNNNMKIRITAAPDQMAYGGQSTGGGLDVGTRKVYGDQPANPYGSLGKTLRPVDREDANIEAEKGETIYGDVDGDGQNEHMTVGGKRHVDGGTPLNVPKGSFVFSDTRKMRIKDEEVLKYFGTSPKKGGVTPAEIAKKYDINKFKAILQDPNSDKLQKDTAKKMIDSYENKLGYLALIQEKMKGFPTGVPEVAQKIMGAAQGTAEMAYGGHVLHQYQGNVGGSTVSAAGGYDPFGVGNLGKGAAAQSSEQALPSWYKPWIYSNTKKGRTSPKGPSSTYNYVQGNPVYDDYQYWRGQSGRDFNDAGDYQRYVFGAIQKNNPDAYKYMENTWGPTAAGKWDDKIMGARTMYAAGQRIKPPEEKPEETPGTETERYICSNGSVSMIAPGAAVPPMAQVYSSQAAAEAACSTKPGKDIPVEKGTTPTVPGFTPTGTTPKGGLNKIDARNLGNALADYASLEQYHGYAPTLQPVLPEFIPQDWRGYAATQQANANSQAQQLGTYQGGQGMAANMSFLAGQQANALGDYISKVDQYNAAGATAKDSERAGILNQYNQANAGARKGLWDDENTYRSQFVAARNDARKGVVQAQNTLEQNAINRYNKNITEPYFQLDPNERVRFDSAKAQQEYIAAMKNPSSILGGTDSDALKKYYDMAIAHGFTPDEARNKSWEYATGKKAPATPKTQEPT